MSDKDFPIAVDIGATKTVVAVYRDGSMQEIGRFPTAAKPDEEVELIVAAVRGDGRASGASALGIGCPGPLNPETGEVLSPPNLTGWKDFPLTGRLEQALGIPARLDNDASVGALGEAVFGTGAGFRSIYYLTISTGIGAGLVVDGRIAGGHRGMAGEVWAVQPGHFYGRTDGGNLNELASGPGLVAATRRRLTGGEASSLADLEGEFNTHEILAAADAGDRLAMSVLDEGRNAIAGLIMAVLFAVAPDSIVLAGGLCTESRWYVDPVREKIRKWMTIPELAEVPIERAKLWDRAVLYGAAQLARE